ncbi:hypothetical protein AWC25_18095 [Mycobacterium sherrisii]|nr:hypothetical protein AWC25_18095 [Mycobacterium sherrisii]
MVAGSHPKYITGSSGYAGHAIRAGGTNRDRQTVNRFSDRSRFALEQGASSAAPAVADPAFNDLTCSCQTPAPPPPSQTSADRINEGLHDAFTR